MQNEAKKNLDIVWVDHKKAYAKLHNILSQNVEDPHKVIKFIENIVIIGEWKYQRESKS